MSLRRERVSLLQLCTHVCIFDTEKSLKRRLSLGEGERRERERQCESKKRGKVREKERGRRLGTLVTEDRSEGNFV